MSEYIYIIKTTGEQEHYRIGIANDPEGLAERLERDYPFVQFTLLHTIRADNHAAQLYRWIYKELAGTCVSKKYIAGSSWHVLNSEQVARLLAIKTETFINLLPECSPKLTPPPPKIALEELEARRTEMLNEIANAEF